MERHFLFGLQCSACGGFVPVMRKEDRDSVTFEEDSQIVARCSDCGWFNSDYAQDLMAEVRPS